jgi:hypothetical protein
VDILLFPVVNAITAFIRVTLFTTFKRVAEFTASADFTMDNTARTVVREDTLLYPDTYGY